MLLSITGRHFLVSLYLLFSKLERTCRCPGKGYCAVGDFGQTDSGVIALTSGWQGLCCRLEDREKAICLGSFKDAGVGLDGGGRRKPLLPKTWALLPFLNSEPHTLIAQRTANQEASGEEGL